MSGSETNPFADPHVDPFLDSTVTEAHGGGARADNLNDFNPFASDQTAIKTPEPAILPASTTQPFSSQSAAYESGADDIRRRQEELERKAAELERRERAMQQSLQGQGVNNFPPLPACCPVKPCFYQDFVLEIPAEFQRIVKAVYYTWIAYSVILFLNMLGAMTYFFGCLHFGLSTESSGITFGLSIIYFVLFIPCSFICWYRPLYKAFRSDSSFMFFVFFFIFFFQACVCVVQALGFPSSGTVGWMSGAEIVGDSPGVGAILFIVGSLFALLSATCFILLIRVHRFYRATGASWSKAQEEFARGVVTNRTVQQTATGVAASAAHGAYGSGASNRY